MVKKVSTINIDEDVLKLAKKEIPNISGFIEDCLKSYLGLNEDMRIRTIQDELNTIKKSQLNIHILTQTDYENAEVTNLNKGKLNEAWLSIWSNYRNTESIIDSDVLNASSILGKSYSYLLEMMNTLLTYVPKQELSFCDEFEYSLNLYEQIVDGD